jgi:hypothetical protein
MTTHTLGPWHERTCTIIQFEGDHHHTEECAELANAQTDETVCYVPVTADGKAYPDGEANARLIALAPEMLEVLEAIVEFWLDDGRSLSPSALIGPFDDNIGNVAAAVVRKAKTI